MSEFLDKVEAFKRGLLDDKIKELTPDEAERLNRIWSGGKIPEEDIGSVYALVCRTIDNPNRKTPDAVTQSAEGAPDVEGEDLDTLLKHARKHTMTDEEVNAQRESYARSAFPDEGDGS